MTFSQVDLPLLSGICLGAVAIGIVFVLLVVIVSIVAIVVVVVVGGKGLVRAPVATDCGKHVVRGMVDINEGALGL